MTGEYLSNFSESQLAQMNDIFVQNAGLVLTVAKDHIESLYFLIVSPDAIKAIVFICLILLSIFFL